VLVGRAAECAQFEDLVARARLGSSGALVLRGEPGIGKSVLLEYAAERSEGMNVLMVHGIESEADIPFAGLLELLRPALAYIDGIPDRQAAALRGALALGPTMPADRFLIGAATLSVLAAYAEERPLLVLVDDAQWLDSSSAAALAFAARRLVADPIAVVLAIRAGELSAFDTSGMRELSLRGLDRDSAAQLLVRHAGQAIPNETAEWLYVATGGNPLALVELAADAPRLRADVFDRPLAIGPRVEQAFMRQIERLPEDLRGALLLAAACDRGDLNTVVAALGRLDIRTRALEGIESAGLVRLERQQLVFRHPLVRSAAYQGSSPLARRAAHRALADALAETGDTDRCAWHLAAASVGPDDHVALNLADAARRALDRSAYAASATAFERSAQLTVHRESRAERLLAGADAAWLAGLPETALTLLDEARAQTDDARRRAEIDHLHGRILLRTGSLPVSHDLFVSAAEEMAAIDPVWACRTLAEAADALSYAGDGPRMLHTVQRAVDLAAANRIDTTTRFFLEMALGETLLILGRGADGGNHVRAALAIFEASDTLSGDPRIVAWAGKGRLYLRETDRGSDQVRRAVDLAREEGALGTLPVALNQLAVDSAVSDRWTEARAEFDEAIRLAREVGVTNDLCSDLAALSRLEARQGRAEDCRAHGAEALLLAERNGLGMQRAWVYLAFCQLELCVGQPLEAIRHAETASALLHDLDFDDPDMSPVPEVVEAHVRLGRSGEARDLAEAYVSLAEQKRLPWALARAGRCRGLLAPDDTYALHFARALNHHDQTSDSFERARTNLCYGERLRRDKRRIQARAQLRAAFETFERLGADPWTERARIELLATGETARRRDVSTIDQLTPQEFQIAHLLAGGLTTREAAARLFLSPKTIEYHLRSIYSKLDVRSRTALAEVMRAKPGTPRR
jgi:ATP/maltotriose-dependent transcriptional regulator MalT